MGGKQLELISVKNSQKKSHDNLGDYVLHCVIWGIPDTKIDITTKILYFSKLNCIVFQMISGNGIQLKNKNKNATGNNHLSTDDYSRINYIFPAFINSSGLHRTLSFKDTVFCPPQRDFKTTHGPVCFFNDQKDTLIVSGLGNFLISPWMKSHSKDKRDVIQYGIHSTISEIPKGFKHESIMVFGQGIRKSFENWGDLLRKYYNLEQKPLNPDLVTSYLGYFTDNGAYYYYNCENGKTSDETLLMVKNQAEKQNIPYNYYHLDSWWYQKTTSKSKQKWLGWLGSILGGALYGGALLWEPDPNYIKISLPEYLPLPIEIYLNLKKKMDGYYFMITLSGIIL